MAQSSQHLGGRVSGYFSSARNQRRFFWLSASVLVVGIAAFVALVVLRGTGNAFPDRFSNEPATLNKPEKTVPVTREQTDLARRFIETAVAREDLDAAYDMVNTDLKGTMTRKQWATGDIPVITYHTANARTTAFTVKYAHPTSALFEVDLVAKPHTETRPHLRFYIGLKRENTESPWLVDYWQPHWRPPVPMAPG